MIDDLSISEFARALGRLGGLSRSVPKIDASRRNGKLGGRPKKKFLDKNKKK